MEVRSGPTSQRIEGKTRCVLPVRLEPSLPAGALVLIQPTVRSLLGDNPILQEVQADGSLSVMVDNLECEDVDLKPGTLVGSVQEVTATPAVLHSDNSPPRRLPRMRNLTLFPRKERSSGW